MYVDRFKLAKGEHKECSNCLNDLDGCNFIYRISFVSTDHFDICERCAKSLQRNLNFQLDLAKSRSGTKVNIGSSLRSN